MKVYPDSQGRGGLSKRDKSDSGGISLFADSLRHQTTEFFNNSTLHGVRYIAEKDRPFCEKFMWFSFTAVGAVTTCIIIVSLWEKFQTNPTITGLDTDFHNWDVPFPAVTICNTNPVDDAVLEEYITNTWGNAAPERASDLLRWLATLSYRTIGEKAAKFATEQDLVSTFDDSEKELKTVVNGIVQRCDMLFFDCEWKGDAEECCDLLAPVYTEMGFCYAFNSRHAERSGLTADQFVEAFIHETDTKWSFMFSSYDNDTVMDIYIHSTAEMAGLELSAQLAWDRRVDKISFSVKHTYTTEDARQLSIRQRRCIFADEQRLETSSVYTYSACMRQCRMRLCRSYCNCVPHFYPSINGYRHCTIRELKCIAEHVSVITDVTYCNCELGCSHTVYEVEKLSEIDLFDTNSYIFRALFWGTGRIPALQDLLKSMHMLSRNPFAVALHTAWWICTNKNTGATSSLETEFVSWPMVRYKREVLFGWVDLLVSFGGIAGLFLGFSLLSGVELVYYFTLRACCAVARDSDMLKQERAARLAKPKPPYDLSLVPWWQRPPAPRSAAPLVVKPKEGKPPQYSPPPGYTTYLP